MRRRNETECTVAKLTTHQAAEAVGKSRSTIWRDIKRGRLSAERTDGGDFQVDVSELERVYGALKPPDTSHDGAPRPPATSNETSSLQVENALLRERVSALEQDKRDLRGERDRLLGLLEQQAEQVRLLTDQRVQKEPARTPLSVIIRRWLGR